MPRKAVGAPLSTVRSTGSGAGSQHLGRLCSYSRDSHGVFFAIVSCILLGALSLKVKLEVLLLNPFLFAFENGKKAACRAAKPVLSVLDMPYFRRWGKPLFISWKRPLVSEDPASCLSPSWTPCMVQLVDGHGMARTSLAWPLHQTCLLPTSHPPW